ncbi:MAG TPA: hypothetical protein VMT18_00510 [Planctomycetota bacterium]|nr:hypothetical protein [Planctomycetota bacterium]
MSDATTPEELPELETLEPLSAPAGGPRELEAAPLMLRKASLILAVAALLPWLKPGGFAVDVLIGKAVVLLGALVCYWGVLAAHGDKAPGFIAALAKSNARLPGWIGLAILVGGFCVPPYDFAAIVERGTLLVGALVWLQVLAYEKGGKFNPVGGMVIPLIGIAGLGRIATIFKEFDALALLGSLGVVAAGGMAGYTMVVAMKEAKAHGEAKKKAALEERKRARAAQKSRT